MRGASADSGPARARRTPAGKRVQLRVTLAGTKGTITVRVGQACGSATGAWNALSGSRAYVGVAGSGRGRGSIPCTRISGSIRISTSGRYSGVGIEVSTVDSELRVIAPIDNTPAQRAGIRSGDTILSVDGIPVNPDRLHETVDEFGASSRTPLVFTINGTNDQPVIAPIADQVGAEFVMDGGLVNDVPHKL